jgi:flagellar motility protein MotE (MotC chaperone)
MKKDIPHARKRHFRLLPAVVIVGTALLGLRASDLIHSAYAKTDGSAGLSADLTSDPVPANPDYAGTSDGAQASAAEVDVQDAMAKRRRELDARQGQIADQARMLTAAEQRVDAKIGQLKKLQATITTLLGQRDDAQKAQIAALVKTYSNMKPKDAARIFDTLPDDVLVPVAQAMKADVLGTVLASMNPDNARALTVKLATRLTLPETTDAVAPAATAQPQPAQTAKAAATPQAATTPAPAKTGG